MTSLTFSQLSPAMGQPRAPGGNTEDQARHPDQIGPDFCAVFFADRVKATTSPEAQPDLDLAQPQTEAGNDSGVGVPEEEGSFEGMVTENGWPQGPTRDERGDIRNRTREPSIWTAHPAMTGHIPEKNVAPMERPEAARVSEYLRPPVASVAAPALSQRKGGIRAAIGAVDAESRVAGQPALSSFPVDPSRQVAPIGTALAGLSASIHQSRFASGATVSPTGSMPADAMTGVNARTGGQARPHPLPLLQSEHAFIAGSPTNPSTTTGTAETANPAPFAPSPAAKWTIPDATGAEPDRASDSRSETMQDMGLVSTRWPGGPIAIPAGQQNNVPFAAITPDAIHVQDPDRAATERKPAFSSDDASHGIPGSQAGQGTGPVVAASAAAAPSETARRIAHQMVAAIVDNRESGAVDVRLNPKELGSVQITLKAQDGGLALAILAERPETLDLMRRHIDQLSAEFRAIGYSDVAFSFGGRDTGAGSFHQENGDRSHVISSGTDIEHGPADASRPKIANGALDIRL